MWFELSGFKSNLSTVKAHMTPDAGLRLGDCGRVQKAMILMLGPTAELKTNDPAFTNPMEWPDPAKSRVHGQVYASVKNDWTF